MRLVFSPFLPEFNACHNHRCRNTHDIGAYLAAKPKDIHFPSLRDLSTTPPFVHIPDVQVVDAGCPSLDTSTTCPVYNVKGECNHGFKCRFLGNHVRKDDDGRWQVTNDESKRALSAVSEHEVNFIGPTGLKQVRSKKVRLHVGTIWRVLTQN